jgi:hypothetical protein
MSACTRSPAARARAVGHLWVRVVWAGVVWDAVLWVGELWDGVVADGSEGVAVGADIGTAPSLLAARNFITVVCMLQTVADAASGWGP